MQPVEKDSVSLTIKLDGWTLQPVSLVCDTESGAVQVETRVAATRQLVQINT